MVEYLFEEQSKRKMYQWAAIALVTFTLVLLASIFGLTWAVVAALKDTKITQQVLVTKQGIPVQTASTEYMLDSTGLLTPRNLTTQNDANPAVRTGGYVGVQGDLHSELDLNTLLEMNVFHVSCQERLPFDAASIRPLAAWQGAGGAHAHTHTHACTLVCMRRWHSP